MRSNQGKIAAVTCAPSSADSFTQVVVSNRVQFRPAANFAVGPERPQGSSCRFNASPHTKHSFTKRTQSKNMVRLPVRCTLPVLIQTIRTGPRYSGSSQGCSENQMHWPQMLPTTAPARPRSTSRNKLPDTRLRTRSSLQRARFRGTWLLMRVTCACM